MALASTDLRVCLNMFNSMFDKALFDEKYYITKSDKMKVDMILKTVTSFLSVVTVKDTPNSQGMRLEKFENRTIPGLKLRDSTVEIKLHDLGNLDYTKYDEVVSNLTTYMLIDAGYNRDDTAWLYGYLRSFYGNCHP